MIDLPTELLAAVNEQAEARVAMSIQGYAKYLTPEAVDTLRASFPGVPPRVNRFDIAEATESGGEYTVEVQYFSRDEPFTVRSRWRQVGTEWKVVHAERLWGADEKRPGVLSRLAATVLRPLARLRR